LVDGQQSQWRSTERQSSFGGKSEHQQIVVGQLAKGDVCVIVECAK
jgi:hypothetical protein